MIDTIPTSQEALVIDFGDRIKILKEKYIKFEIK